MVELAGVCCVPQGHCQSLGMPRGITATWATQGRSRMGCSSWYLHPSQHCCRPSQTCQHTCPKEQRNSRWLPTTRAISSAPSPHSRMSPSVAQPDEGQGTSTQHSASLSSYMVQSDWPGSGNDCLGGYVKGGSLFLEKWGSSVKSLEMTQLQVEDGWMLPDLFLM